MMEDIVLFRPKEFYSRAIKTKRYPLGLIHLGTVLRENGFKVKIIDTETCLDWKREIGACLKSGPLCVGISVMTGHQIKEALEFSEFVKQRSSAPVIWGGLHPTLLPHETLANKLVDIVVIGEAEETILDLAEGLKNRKRLDGLKGIMHKARGRIIPHACRQDFVDMNKLPVPHYDLVDMGYYRSQNVRYLGVGCVDLNTSRGCPCRCAFCYNINVNKRRYRGMSSGRLLYLIEKIQGKHAINGFNFVADNFFTDKTFVRGLCEGIIRKRYDIRWHSDMRIDAFTSYEDDLIKLIKKSGCRTITFGVESGSDRILRSIHKDISVKDVMAAHKRALQFGFHVNYHFMIGFPRETRQDMIKTCSLITKLMNDKNVNIYGPSIYTPYPGTPLYQRCVQLGFQPPKSLEGWIDFDWEKINTPWLSKADGHFIRQVITFVNARKVHKGRR